MNMRKQIEKVHFQITRNCNLRCAFCGQWGKKGFFSDASGEEISLCDWKRVISELEACREKTKISPQITVWGGEPLVSPYFDTILQILKTKNFETEVITNGVLMDKHEDVIKNCVDTLYISLDGTKEIHDEIRGRGVFDTVCKNIKSLKHDNIIVMSVITPKLIDVLPKFLEELESLNIKALYLQDMIGLSGEEINEYERWMKETFNITAKDIKAWKNDSLFRVQDIQTGDFSYKIEHKKHISTKEIHCKFPFNHVHIAWNGNVLYCTDFYDFSAGNIKDDTLQNIFFNKISEKYREEIVKNNCITCKHCSWRNS